MNDLYHSTVSVKEAIFFSKDLKIFILLGSFNLTIWSSITLETMKSIPQKDQNPNDTKESTMQPPIVKHGEIDKQIPTTDTERVLGLQWLVSRDSFAFISRTFE